jgi:hypothetical protein
MTRGRKRKYKSLEDIGVAFLTPVGEVLAEKKKRVRAKNAATKRLLQWQAEEASEAELRPQNQPQPQLNNRSGQSAATVQDENDGVEEDANNRVE